MDNVHDFLSGPGIVDYSAWEKYHFATERAIQRFDDPQVRGDLMKMFDVVREKWLQYSRTSLYYKKHNTRLFDIYNESRRNLDKYMMMAGLMN